MHSVNPNEALLKHLKDISLKNNIKIFAGTAFKYQSPEPNPAKAALLAQDYGLIATSSGSGTGHAADLTKIKSMSRAVNGHLALASGLTINNLADYHPYVEFALVATGISQNEHYFDSKKLVAFIDKAQELNSKKHVLIAEE